MKKSILILLLSFGFNTIAQTITWHNIPTALKNKELTFKENDFIEFTVHNMPVDQKYVANFRFYNGEQIWKRYTQLYLNDMLEKDRRNGFKNRARFTQVISTKENEDGTIDRRVRIYKLLIEGNNTIPLDKAQGNNIYPHIRIIGKSGAKIEQNIDFYVTKDNLEQGNPTTKVVASL